MFIFKRLIPSNLSDYSLFQPFYIILYWYILFIFYIAILKYSRSSSTLDHVYTNQILFIVGYVNSYLNLHYPNYARTYFKLYERVAISRTPVCFVYADI